MLFCKTIVSGPKIKIAQKLLHFSIWTYFVFTLFSKKNVSKNKRPFVCVNIEISNPQQLSGSERVTIMILILLSEVWLHLDLLVFIDVNNALDYFNHWISTEECYLALKITGCICPLIFIKCIFNTFLHRIVLRRLYKKRKFLSR